MFDEGLAVNEIDAVGRIRGAGVGGGSDEDTGELGGLELLELVSLGQGFPRDAVCPGRSRLGGDLGSEGSGLKDLLEDSSALEPAEEAERQELRKMLVEGINNLPERSKQVISLYYVDELTPMEIADVLGVHMNWFFPGGSNGPAHERDVVVRASNRRNLTFTGLGITEELLSPNLSGPLELLISTIHPGADSEYYTHDGAEAGLVMNGTLELWVDDEHYRLQTGDSFAFPSTTPHRCANHGKKPVKVLWVITPPHY